MALQQIRHLLALSEEDDFSQISTTNMSIGVMNANERFMVARRPKHRFEQVDAISVNKLDQKKLIRRLSCEYRELINKKPSAQIFREHPPCSEKDSRETSITKPKSATVRKHLCRRTTDPRSFFDWHRNINWSLSIS